MGLQRGGANGAAGVAIYARVSTDDKGQDPENQLLQLRAWCARMGYPVVREYVEHENGGKGLEYRKQLAAMFTGAARREFDLLLVWSLDRFSREGMAATGCQPQLEPIFENVQPLREPPKAPRFTIKPLVSLT
jgi:predicted site-specific integrase-resolvase